MTNKELIARTINAFAQHDQEGSIGNMTLSERKALKRQNESNARRCERQTFLHLILSVLLLTVILFQERMVLTSEPASPNRPS